MHEENEPTSNYSSKVFQPEFPDAIFVARIYGQSCLILCFHGNVFTQAIRVPISHVGTSQNAVID